MGQITRTNYGIHSRTVISNAQLLAAPPVSVELVAAIPGKIIIPSLAILYLDWTADYSAIDAAASIQIQTGVGGYPFLASVNESADGDVTGLLANGEDGLAFMYGSDQTQVPAMPATPGNSSLALFSSVAAVVGVALYFAIVNGGAVLEGGDPANQMTVDVFYNVIEAFPPPPVIVV